MRFQKLLILFLVFSLSLSLFSQTALHAADITAPASAPIKVEAQVQKTDTSGLIAQAEGTDQDKLLELLQRKQAELDAQESSAQKQTPAPIAPAKPVAPAALIAPKPAQPVVKPKESVVEPKVKIVEPKTVAEPKPRIEPKPVQPVKPKMKDSEPSAVISQPTIAPEKQDELLELLRKKQEELDAKEVVVTPEKAPMVAPSKTIERTIEPTKPVEKPAEKITAKESEESNKRLRQIEAELKAKEEAIKKAVAQPAPAQPKESARKEVIQSTPQPKVETRVSAPLATGGSKESRLAELLRKYKADEITPHDYHVQRAKILAEP